MEFTIVAFFVRHCFRSTHRQMRLSAARWLEWISQSALRRFSASDSFHEFIAIQKKLLAIKAYSQESTLRTFKNSTTHNTFLHAGMQTTAVDSRASDKNM